MKLVILIPSPDYRSNAGTRIRYGRITAALAELGMSLSLVEIDEFDVTRDRPGIVLISKVYDARSQLAATDLSERGIAVGLDLFDDYFSDPTDVRLAPMRSWLQSIIRKVDFALCSTPSMAAVVESYHRSLPIHILNDPGPATDWRGFEELLREKLAGAHSSNLLRICWFGMGDNPHFPVGISDVAAHSDMLAELNRNGWAVELALLTNPRALNAGALAQISRLPVPTTVQLWSETVEAETLRRSIACYLPVNAQPFSTAKSLNRAVTALCSGCQLLSAGFPLYSALDPFIYRRAPEFLHDLSDHGLRLSLSSFEKLKDLLAGVASAPQEAARLKSFLSGISLEDRKSRAPSSIYLIHGLSSSPATHAMVKRAGGLSVGTSFTKAHLEFDVLANVRPGPSLRLRIADQVIRRVQPERRKNLAANGMIGKRKFWSVEGERDTSQAAAGEREIPVPLLLAIYGQVMKQLAARVRQLFGPGEIIVSENSPLPLDSRN